MNPLVSILIPVRNCEAWIEQALRSAVSQTWSNVEIIVLDDGSSDGSIYIAQKFLPKIRIESGRFGGQNTSRNRLLELSRGEWLVFLDADDELAPDSIERKLEAAAGADVVYGSMDAATFIGRDKVRSEPREADEYDDPWVAAFGWCYPNTSSMMVRKDALLSVGGFPTHVANCTDYALYFQLLLKGYRFVPAAKSWTIYRQWSRTQAVYEDPLRRLVTKLELVDAARRALEDAGAMTPARLAAWSDQMLGTLRMLYRYDREKTAIYLKRFQAVNPRHRPSKVRFSRFYSVAEPLLGFYLTEWCARLTRAVRRKIYWRQGLDPVADFQEP